MYNPFPILTPGLLAAELSAGKRYFVRQFFPRGMDASLRAAFLLRAYRAVELADALTHFAGLTADPNCFLYDGQNEQHGEKLRIAARQPIGYKLFYAGSKGVNWKPPVPYQQMIKRYLQSTHPDWRTKKGGPEIEVGLCEHHGNLFLKLDFMKEHETIPLESIENVTYGIYH